MTRHTRSKQLIKLAMMQGEDVKFAKWNYSPGLNVTIKDSCQRYSSIDPSFKWKREKILRIGKLHNKTSYRHKRDKGCYKVIMEDSTVTLFERTDNSVSFKCDDWNLRLKAK